VWVEEFASVEGFVSAVKLVSVVELVWGEEFRQKGEVPEAVSYGKDVACSITERDRKGCGEGEAQAGADAAGFGPGVRYAAGQYFQN